MTATDADADSNGAVTYRMSGVRGGGGGGASAPLEIDRRTGRVTLARDAALRPDNLIFSVVATDEAAAQSARRSATATVIVVGGRENPGPAFTQETYRVRRNEMD